MKVIRRIVVAIFVVMLFHNVYAESADDQTFAKALVGTWLVMEGPTSPPDGEATYAPDGLLTGYNTVTFNSDSGIEHREKVQMTGRWTIRDGVLEIADLRSVPEGIVPTIRSRQYRIQSISTTEAYFEVRSGGKTLYRRKKSGG